MSNFNTFESFKEVEYDLSGFNLQDLISSITQNINDNTKNDKNEITNTNFNENLNNKIINNDIYSKNNYDKRTCVYYKTIRLRKMDPLINLDMDDTNAFIFNDMWDPITGERIQKDPNGGLYFDPDSLIHYFYINRLKNLWNEPTDNNEGYFEGYYDFAVGSGENINIVGRGHCPDKYLLRLPIIDCYLTKDHNDSFVTMGPKLTDEEINKIDEVANKSGDNYKKMFKKERPKLADIKKYYDNSICENPDISKLKEKYPNKTNEELRCMFNREAVEMLKKL